MVSVVVVVVVVVAAAVVVIVVVALELRTCLAVAFSSPS